MARYIIELPQMPSCCHDCWMLIEVQDLAAYCLAGGFAVKISETDMRDGLCPIQVE